MIKVYMKEFGPKYGDCLRACIASILEFNSEEMPNFWRQTQDGLKFNKLINEWLAKNKQYKLITIKMEDNHNYFIDNLLCIAVLVNKKGVEHAVVYKNKILHDPNPKNPDSKGYKFTGIFSVFCPQFF